MQASWTKPRKLVSIVLPTNQETSFPLEPGKEAFDELATFIAV